MAIQFYPIICNLFNDNWGVTEEGGIYEVFVNNTGETSVKGTVVIASTTVANGVDKAPAGSYVPIGAIYEDGIANGENVKVVVYGKTQVLLASNATATVGYWCGVSNDAAGKVYQLQNAPVAASTHGQEVGHSIQTVTTVNTLTWIQMHFN